MIVRFILSCLDKLPLETEAEVEEEVEVMEEPP